MVQLVETLVASQFQKDIYHWVEFGSGNAIIKAVAGSGKTTVLKHSCKIIFDKFGAQPLAIAFNKHIKDELSLKIGEYAQIQTFNSLGHRLVGNSLGRGYLKVDDDKYRNICKKVIIDRK
jgi:DNA helicase-2/ATP-dependent DNA helicase PcrA